MAANSSAAIHPAMLVNFSSGATSSPLVSMDVSGSNFASDAVSSVEAVVAPIHTPPATPINHPMACVRKLASAWYTRGRAFISAKPAPYSPNRIPTMYFQSMPCSSREGFVCESRKHSPQEQSAHSMHRSALAPIGSPRRPLALGAELIKAIQQIGRAND
ncbi:hypothetical protein G6F22_017308 [Rhizopus arrhizus]|nr:hypothetical protein G6F22_017308 [Rhizopus arrhizus]